MQKHPLGFSKVHQFEFQLGKQANNIIPFSGLANWQGKQHLKTSFKRMKLIWVLLRVYTFQFFAVLSFRSAGRKVMEAIKQQNTPKDKTSPKL